MVDVKALRRNFETARADYLEAQARLERARSRQAELERELAALREKAKEATDAFAVGRSETDGATTADELAEIRVRIDAIVAAVNHLRRSVPDMERRINEAYERMRNAAGAVARSVFDREIEVLDRMLRKWARDQRVHRQATRVVAAANLARGRLNWAIEVEDLAGDAAEIERETADIRQEIGPDLAASVPLK